jgi:TonB family protein
MNAELVAANIAAHWMQSGLLAAAALTSLWLITPAKPSFRVAALQFILALTIVLPTIQPWNTSLPAAPSEIVTTTVTIAGEPSAPGARTARFTWPDVAQLVVMVVGAGVVLRLSWLLFGLLRLSRFTRAAADVSAPAAAADLEAQLGVSPRYILQLPNRGPWTFGIFRPTIALPSTFDALAPAVQRSVICHELLHVKRRDVIAALVEEIVVAALWFHPWAWLLRSRIRVAREQTVDARAVAMLGSRDEYVRCLVDMSGHDLAPHLSHAGAGMLRPRELRTRIDAILKEVHMSRGRATVAAALLVSVMAGTCLMASGLFPLRTAGGVETIVQAPGRHIELARVFSRGQTPVAPSSEARRQIRMTPAEYPPDALAKGIRGTVMVDITINPAGDVTTASVVSGPQELRAAAFNTAMGLKYEPGASTTAARVGVQFQMDRMSWGVRIVDLRPSVAGGAIGARAVGAFQPSESTQASGVDWMGAVRVGGDVRPPRKIKDVPPVYPETAQNARVQGVVVLEARVDESGNVSDAKPLRSIPLLDDAAIDAVKQWKYEPSLLNGAPTAVVMTLTVNFTLRDLFDVQLLLPDGNTASVSLQGASTIVAPGGGSFRLRAMRDRSRRAVVVSTYQEDGQTLLGDVLVEEGGAVVQLPTTPPMGLKLIAIR